MTSVTDTTRIELWTDEDGEPMALIAAGDVPPHLFTAAAAIEAAMRDEDWSQSEAEEFFGTDPINAGPIWLRREDEETFSFCEADHPEAIRYTGVRVG